MHGHEVHACDLMIEFGQYAPEANHGPHEHDGVWCAGYATQKWACRDAPLVESIDDGHGGHAWRHEDSETWVWCVGYRQTYDPPAPSSEPVWSKYRPEDLEAGWFEPRDGWDHVDNGRPR